MVGIFLLFFSGVFLERFVQVVMERGYMVQGEMFLVVDMGSLVQEVLGCQVKLFFGGLGSFNRDFVLWYLVIGYFLFIFYDEDFNYELCQRKGYKVYWVVSVGVLLGVWVVFSFGYIEDFELLGLFYLVLGMFCQLLFLLEEGFLGVVYLLFKQGKSWYYQLWDYD